MINIEEFEAVLDTYKPKQNETGNFFDFGSPTNVHRVASSRIDKIVEKLREKIKNNPTFSLHKLMYAVDKDKSGRIEIGELQEFLSAIDDSLTRAEVKEIYGRIDKNGREAISMDELSEYLGWDDIKTENL